MNWFKQAFGRGKKHPTLQALEDSEKMIEKMVMERLFIESCSAGKVVQPEDIRLHQRIAHFLAPVAIAVNKDMLTQEEGIVIVKAVRDLAAYDKSVFEGEDVGHFVVDMIREAVKMKFSV
jgi:hypothetical protein